MGSTLLTLILVLQQDEIDRRVRFLKDQLKLSDDQAEKVREVLKSDQEARQKLEKEREEKIRGVLSDEQKQSYERMRPGRVERFWGDGEDVQKALEEARKRMEEFREKGFEGFKFEGFGDEFFQGFRRGDGGGSLEARVKSAMDALKIEDPKEAEVVRDLVRKVVDAQKALEDHEREAQKAVDSMLKDSALSDEALETKIAGLRAERREKEGAVRKAQSELAEVVTYRQELELLKRKILR
jgi:hypothetical protein